MSEKIPEQLQRLAGLAPPAPFHSTPPQGAAQPSKRLGGPKYAKSNDLGTLDVGKYLSAHGIEYHTKPTDGGTRYCLRQCLFDPAHAGNEASIVQSVNAPFLTYQCFHASCKGRTWKDARQRISGDKSLAEWCANYDPNWKPPLARSSGMLAGVTVPAPEGLKVADAPVPPPHDMDPAEFFEQRGKRAAPSFVEAYMVRYICAYLVNLVYTDGLFWRYEGGVWKEYPRDAIGSIVVHALKDHVKAAWVENTINILQRTVYRRTEDWPTHPELINCKNGMVDLDTFELLPHDPVYGSRAQIPCMFDPKALANVEKWLTALDAMFPEKDEAVKLDVMQQYFGYCLLTDCRFQTSLFLNGTGANGKSVVLEVLEGMVGSENTASLSIAHLAQRFAPQFLQDKLVNLATETTSHDLLSTEVFKAAVAGDPIMGERKFGEPFKFRPYCKFVIALNEPPLIVDKSHGFARRLIVLNFNRRFTEEEQIKNLAKQIIADERDGVFMWALMGLESLLKRGDFIIPEKIKRDKEEFMGTLNPFLLWVSERCTLGDGLADLTTTMYRDYLDWCKFGRNRPLSRNRFYDQMLMNFPAVRKEPYGPDRRKNFVGICLDPARETLDTS